MKKSKLLILSAALGLLVACGGAPTGGSGDNTLPSGGTTADLKTEEGKQALKSSMQKLASSVTEMPDSLELDLSASGINLALNGEVAASASGMDIAAKVNLNVSDVNANVNLKAARHAHSGSEYDGIDAALTSSESGKVSLSGSLTAPDYEAMMAGEQKTKTNNFDASLSINAKESAYLVDGATVYADLSDQGIDNAVKGAENFVNKIYGDLKDSIVGMLLAQYLSDVPVYNAETDKFEFATLLDQVLPEGRKIALDIPAEQQVVVPVKGEGSDPVVVPDETIEQAAQMLDMVGAKFVTYSSGAFGVELSLNKTTVAALLDQFVPSAEQTGGVDVKKIFADAVSKLDVYAYAYFNEKGLPEKVGLTWDVAASYSFLDMIPQDSGVEFTKAQASLSTKGEVKVSLKIGGVTVSFPSFDGYKHMNTGPLTLE